MTNKFMLPTEASNKLGTLATNNNDSRLSYTIDYRECNGVYKACITASKNGKVIKRSYVI